MNNNIVFCTITYGEKHIKYSKNLIKQITSYGYNFIVYTFNPESYEEMNRLTIIKNNNPYFSYHQKLEVVKEAIKTYETVVYLDADVEIVGDDIDFSILDKIDYGLHIFATFGSL
jgi:hypothetical protein